MSKEQSEKENEKFDSLSIDNQVKLAERDKLIAEKNSAELHRRNYWFRSAIAFFSLGGILAFLLTYVITPTVEMQVRDVKRDLLDKQEVLDSIKNQYDLGKEELSRKEEKINFYLKQNEQISEYNKELEQKIINSNKILKELQKSLKESPKMSSKNREKLSKVEKISDEFKVIEEKKEAVASRVYKSRCDILQETIKLKKNGKRYYLELPRSHPTLSERIGVWDTLKPKESRLIMYKSISNKIKSSTAVYTYLKRISKAVDNEIVKTSNNVPVAEIKCDNQTIYIEY